MPQPPIQEWLGGSSFQKCLWTSQGPWRIWLMNDIKRLAQSLANSEHSTNVNYFSRFHVQLELRITEMENWTWFSGVGGLAGRVEMLRKERDISFNKICPWDEGIWLDTRAPGKMNHYSSETRLTQCLCFGVGRAVLLVVTRSWDSGAPLFPNSPHPKPNSQHLPLILKGLSWGYREMDRLGIYFPPTINRVLQLTSVLIGWGPELIRVKWAAVTQNVEWLKDEHSLFFR